MTRKRITAILLALSITITAYTGIFSSIIPEVSAFTEGEVKFRGVATTDEQLAGHDICNGIYYVNVTITEILYDPNHILFLGREVSVCYNQSISVVTGDEVECYGHYWLYTIYKGPMDVVSFHIPVLPISVNEPLPINWSDLEQLGWIIYFGVEVKCVGNDYYIIPEFSSLFILPLFMIGTLAAVACVEKKKKGVPPSSYSTVPYYFPTEQIDIVRKMKSKKRRKK